MTTKITGDNIGIGTTSPSGKLHLSSGTSGDCELIIEADTDNNLETDNPRILFRQDGGNDWSAIGNGINSSNDNNALVLANSINTNGGIIFQTGTGLGYTNATERVRIQSGGGISFNGDTAAANALDDYEEGTWTPVYAGATTAGTYTYVANIGKYQKIGNTVTVWCALQDITTSSAGSGAATVTGLPFANGGGFITIGNLLLDKFDLASTSIRALHTRISTSATHVVLRVTRNGLTDTSIAADDRDSNGSDLEFCITYLVS